MHIPASERFGVQIHCRLRSLHDELRRAERREPGTTAGFAMLSVRCGTITPMRQPHLIERG